MFFYIFCIILTSRGKLYSIVCKLIFPTGQYKIGLFSGGNGDGIDKNGTFLEFIPIRLQNLSLLKIVADIINTRNP